MNENVRLSTHIARALEYRIVAIYIIQRCLLLSIIGHVEQKNAMPKVQNNFSESDTMRVSVFVASIMCVICSTYE